VIGVWQVEKFFAVVLVCWVVAVCWFMPVYGSLWWFVVVCISLGSDAAPLGFEKFS